MGSESFIFNVRLAIPKVSGQRACNGNSGDREIKPYK
jgi:hypothetical protein